MIIAGTGCVLMDYLYNGVDFAAPACRRLQSRQPGDGGLVPGQLVFAEDLEGFAARPLAQLMQDLVGTRPPDAENLGGPAVVAMIQAAQLLAGTGDFQLGFHGARGEDAAGQALARILAQTPLEARRLLAKPGNTPLTNVLSDPNYLQGKGERTFINRLGAAGDFTPEDLDESFFGAQLQLFGGTALVPKLHDALRQCLSETRRRGGLAVVGTVYDFRNEQLHPERPWPLGDSIQTYRQIDLLVADREEARRLSGCADPAAAVRQFLAWGAGAVIVTRGTDPVLLQSAGTRFAPLALTELPVSAAICRELAEHPERRGDTTGCGDNFVGGVLAALATQLAQARMPDLATACAWGIVSGGLACFQLGGTRLERYPGEQRQQLRPRLLAYAAQIGRDLAALPPASPPPGQA